MINIKLKEVLQTLQGLKEQASVVIQLLDDNIAVKLEDTELAEIQSKINAEHMNIFYAYISHGNQNSYTDIDEELFKKWFPHYEANEEYYQEEFLGELKGISRRFDSLAYRVVELHSDEELHALAREMRKKNATTVMATVSLEDYKK